MVGGMLVCPWVVGVHLPRGYSTPILPLPKPKWSILHRLCFPPCSLPPLPQQRSEDPIITPTATP